MYASNTNSSSSSPFNVHNDVAGVDLLWTSRLSVAGEATALEDFEKDDSQRSSNNSNNNGMLVILSPSQVAQLLEHVIDPVLTEVEEALAGLQAEQVSSAVQRASQDGANLAHQLAQELQDYLQEQQNMVVVEDLQLQTTVMSSDEEPTRPRNVIDADETVTLSSIPMDLHNRREDDFLLSPNNPTPEQVIQIAIGFLQDVEATLRQLDPDDADELAQVGLMVAQMWIGNVRTMYNQVVPRLLASEDGDEQGGIHSRSTVVIEEVDPSESTSTDKSTSIVATPRSTLTPPTKVRVLWPPIGPHVHSAVEWGQQMRKDHPVLSTALLVTAWPVTLTTAVVGSSLVWVDGLVQDIYDNHREGPPIELAEQVAGQVWQNARLGLVTSRLVAKQSLRLVQQQVDRQGGWDAIAHQAVDACVDRIVHPVETIGMAWNAAAWSVGMVHNAIATTLDQHQEQRAAQELH